MTYLREKYLKKVLSRCKFSYPLVAVESAFETRILIAFQSGLISIPESIKRTACSINKKKIASTTVKEIL